MCNFALPPGRVRVTVFQELSLARSLPRVTFQCEGNREKVVLTLKRKRDSTV
jgi:hypothetical protein